MPDAGVRGSFAIRGQGETRMTLSAVPATSLGEQSARGLTMQSSAAAVSAIPRGLDPTGRLVSLLLWRFWDDDARVLLSAPTIRLVTPTLLAHGMGAMASRYALRARFPRQLEQADDAQRVHRLRARAAEQRMERAVALLEREQIPYLLWNGWSHARLYPEPGLRPFGELELLVDRGDEKRAERALHPAQAGQNLDVRLAAPLLEGALRTDPFGALHERSVERTHGVVRVRCLGAEDELRVACLQLLRQGVGQPTWLCDVALMLEHGPQELDVQRVLHGNAWVGCVIQLARDVLGARVPAELALGIPRARAPAWVERSLIQAWGRPKLGLRVDPVREPRAWLGTLREQLPHPIEVRASAGASPSCGETRARASVLWSAARQLLRLVRARLK
jgi:Uncharacterised nucleotidyltransferase